jgi:hypothetical protein
MVYISDSIVKQEIYPDFPAYARHPLFISPSLHATREAWADYKQDELKRIRLREVEYKNQQGAPIADLLKKVLDDYVQEQGGSLGVATNLARVPIVKPMNEEMKIPDIKEPVDLFTCYSEWQRIRDYFYQVTLPPWKQQYGDNATAIKLRYSRMRPFLMYLDKCGKEAREHLKALDDIRKEHDVRVPAFIKQCFYHMVYPTGPNVKNKPAIPPDALRAAMQERGLPPIK